MISEQKSITLVPELFGREALRSAAPALLAAALLLLAGAFWIAQARSGERRDQTYQQVLTAARQGDVEGLIAGANAFRATPPLLGSDPRHQQVAELQDQALAWRQRLAATPVLHSLVEAAAAAAAAPVSTTRERRDVAFQELQQALAEGDRRGAIESIERYLATPALGLDDQREAEVRRLYPEVFTRWAVSQLGTAEERREHIARFRALSDEEKETPS